MMHNNCEFNKKKWCGIFFKKKENVVVFVEKICFKIRLMDIFEVKLKVRSIYFLGKNFVRNCSST